MPLTITQVDAFTSKPFAGNPAGVCLLTEPKDDAWMQNVAAEMKLAETAFLLHRPDGYGLRWFTPGPEETSAATRLSRACTCCGREAIDETARFHTKSGLLPRFGPATELSLPYLPPPRTAPCGGCLASSCLRSQASTRLFSYMLAVFGSETPRSANGFSSA